MTEFISPPFEGPLAAALLALNNAHAEELSYKTAEGFAALLKAASHVRAGRGGEALIVAFDDRCSYDNPNFHWLKQRYERFYYIDRVVVSAAARGQGLARKLYADLAARAAAEHRERLVCEINLLPPNAASDAFHAALGFSPVGQQALAAEKIVRYWAKPLTTST